MFSPDRFIGNRKGSFGTPSEMTSRPYVGLRTAFGGRYKKGDGQSRSRGSKFPQRTPLQEAAHQRFSEPATPSVCKERGLKPSDLRDTHKKELLTSLSSRLFHLTLEESGESEKITLERLFTPATDGGDLTPKRAGKVFASSAFYRPDHPTIEDQVELAQKISFSLVDENNKMSKGQSMYMRRKKRSVKWIHDEAVAASKQSGTMPGPVASEDMDDLILSQPKEKPPLKNLMSSRGVQDYTQVQERYSTLMTWAQQQPPLSGQPGSPEVQRDIIADMQSPTGKGAALFAKRKKRMDKFIVDETTVQKSSVVTESSTSSSTVTTAQQEQLVTAAAPPPLLQAGGPAAPFAAAPTAAAAKSKSSKQAKSDRDKQQEQIILAETVCDQAAKIAIELPKPVPINDPLPGGPPKAALAPVKPEVQAPPPAPPPQNPLPFPTQGTPVAPQTHLLEQMSQADSAEKRKSFNLAAKGWGTYNTFYKPVTFQAS